MPTFLQPSSRLSNTDASVTLRFVVFFFVSRKIYSWNPFQSFGILLFFRHYLCDANVYTGRCYRAVRCRQNRRVSPNISAAGNDMYCTYFCLPRVFPCVFICCHRYVCPPAVPGRMNKPTTSCFCKLIVDQSKVWHEGVYIFIQWCIFLALEFFSISNCNLVI